MLLVLLAILPSAGLALWHGYTGLMERKEEARSKSLALAAEIADDQDNLVSETKRFLMTLAATAEVKNHDAAGCTQMFRALNKQFDELYVNIFAVDPDGQAFAQSLTTGPLNNYKDREWFQEALHKKVFSTSDFVFGRAVKKPVMAMTYPVLGPDGQVTMVLVVGINLDRMGRQLGAAQLPPRSMVTVLDRDGVVLAHMPEKPELIGSNLAHFDFVKKMLGEKEGLAETDSIDGIPMLVGFTKLFKDVPTSPTLYVAIPRETAYAHAQTTLYVQLFWLMVVALLGILAAWFEGGRSLAKPVEVLSGAARALGQGQAGARITQRFAIAELKQLADSFNDMADSLEEQQRALAQKSEELERSNKDLEHFAYIASHDLQEPLRKISSFADLLSRRYASSLDDTAKAYLAFLVDGAKRMSILINHLLAYSRLNTATEKFANVDCNSIVQNVLESLQLTLKEKSATITFEILPTVTGDSVQLSQLFQNLIANALKFCSQSPIITITTRESAGFWEFSVRDNGLGIADDHSERIFRMFQRLHSANEYPGSGIGLAMCKRIVERHGGRIWLESQVGQGSTFYFTLPKAKEQDA